MDDLNSKFPNLKYLSMMRNPASPSLMSFKDPDVDANKFFRLYVLYRCPQLQMIDSLVVTDKERSEARLRGQVCIRLFSLNFFLRVFQ